MKCSLKLRGKWRLASGSVAVEPAESAYSLIQSKDQTMPRRNPLPNRHGFRKQNLAHAGR